MEPGDFLLPAPDGAVSCADLDTAICGSDLEQHQPVCAELAERGGNEYDGVSGCSPDAGSNLGNALR